MREERKKNPHKKLKIIIMKLTYQASLFNPNEGKLIINWTEFEGFKNKQLLPSLEIIQNTQIADIEEIFNRKLRQHILTATYFILSKVDALKFGYSERQVILLTNVKNSIGRLKTTPTIEEFLHIFKSVILPILEDLSATMYDVRSEPRLLILILKNIIQNTKNQVVNQVKETIF